MIDIMNINITQIFIDLFREFIRFSNKVDEALIDSMIINVDNGEKTRALTNDIKK